jgi:hypothetical protein
MQCKIPPDLADFGSTPEVVEYGTEVLETVPAVLFVRGWRVFFYSDEGTEPVHVHARKGDAECKLWLREDVYAGN